MSAISIRELLGSRCALRSPDQPAGTPRCASTSSAPATGSTSSTCRRPSPLFRRPSTSSWPPCRGARSVLFVGHQEAGARSGAHARSAMWHVPRHPALARWHADQLPHHQGQHRAPAPIDKMLTDGTSDKLTKKETLNLYREREKLEANLGGIKNMERCPGAGLHHRHHEGAHRGLRGAKLGIKVMAIVDTNSDPEYIDFPIPGNDDAIRAIELFTSPHRRRRARGPPRPQQPVRWPRG
jgi:ribosomal protein S2